MDTVFALNFYNEVSNAITQHIFDVISEAVQTSKPVRDQVPDSGERGTRGTSGPMEDQEVSESSR